MSENENTDILNLQKQTILRQLIQTKSVVLKVTLNKNILFQ